jgi:hypothetical protein
MAAVLSVVACSSGKAPPPTPSQPPAQGEEGPALSEAWTTDLKAMHLPLGTGSGFAFYRFTPDRAFEIVNLDAETGEVRWSEEASPSAIVGGEGLVPAVTPDRKRVIWMRSAKGFSRGLVTLVAAEEETGEVAWEFGAGKLEVQSTPSVCRDGKAFCVVGRRAPGERVTLMTLDIKTGKLVSDRAVSAAENFREVSEGLRDDGRRFLAVNGAGKQLWTRSFKEVFDGADVAPDFGWDIQLQDGRYVGSLGYRDNSGREPNSVDLRRTGDTAAFDARTGRTLWVKHGATVQCGSLQFLIDHPMRCTYKGSLVAKNGAQDYKGLEVTVEGFDPKTGKSTWTWKAGNVPALYEGGAGVTRIGPAQYAVKAGKGTTILDADEGPVGKASGRALAGWCDGSNTAVPRENRQIASFGGDQGYNTFGWYPCSTIGDDLEQPPSTPSFAVTTVKGVSVWTDQDGEVNGSVSG